MLPTDAKERKDYPITTGVLDYFPDALLELARVSKFCSEQHSPGHPLRWAKELSTDHSDALNRHMLQRGTLDTDGMMHTAKVAWRALALLQTELEAEMDEINALKADYGHGVNMAMPEYGFDARSEWRCATCRRRNDNGWQVCVCGVRKVAEVA